MTSPARYRRAWALAAAAFVWWSGCTTMEFELPEGRGPVDDAELSGQCEPTLCGGPSAGNCYCDDICGLAGDCCTDKIDVCGIVCPVAENDHVECPQGRIFDAETCECRVLIENFSPDDCPVLDPDSVTCIPGYAFDLDRCECVRP